MYAVGHFALGYLTGKLTGKALDVQINLPLLFLASVIPDIDIVIPGLVHRGPLHSVLVLSLIFIPLLLIYKKGAAPYFIAVISHVLIGDYLVGGDLQLLWPLTTSTYGLQVGMTSLMHVALEWSLFLTAIAVMTKTRDIFSLFKQNSSKMILSIPAMTVLLPTIAEFPLYVPISLVIPHVFFIILLTVSIIIDLKIILTKT